MQSTPEQREQPASEEGCLLTLRINTYCLVGTVGTPIAVFLHGLMGLKIFSIFYAELLFSRLPEHQTTQKRKLAASLAFPHNPLLLTFSGKEVPCEMSRKKHSLLPKSLCSKDATLSSPLKLPKDI